MKLNYESKNDELCCIKSYFKNEFLDWLISYYQQHNNLSYDDAVQFISDYTYLLNVKENSEPNICFFMMFFHSVFDVSVDDFTTLVQCLPLFEGIEPSLLELCRRIGINIGLIVRKIDDDTIITYFDKIYTSIKIPNGIKNDDKLQYVR